MRWRPSPTVRVLPRSAGFSTRRDRGTIIWYRSPRGILGDVEIDRALPVVAQDRGIFCVVLEGALLGELDRRCFAEIVEEVDRSFGPAGVAVFLGAPEGFDVAGAKAPASAPLPSSPDSLTEEEKAALFSPIDFGAYAEADGEGEEEIFDEEELLRTVIREPVRRPAAPPPPLDDAPAGAGVLDAIPRSSRPGNGRSGGGGTSTGTRGSHRRAISSGCDSEPGLRATAPSPETRWPSFLRISSSPRKAREGTRATTSCSAS